MNNGIIIILGGAGFCPSTVSFRIFPVVLEQPNLNQIQVPELQNFSALRGTICVGIGVSPVPFQRCCTL